MFNTVDNTAFDTEREPSNESDGDNSIHLGNILIDGEVDRGI